MPYKEVKVYNDGSHYIGIPHTTRPNLPRRQTVEEEIAVVETNESEMQQENTSSKQEGVTSDAKIIEIDGMRIDTETGEVLPSLIAEPIKAQRKTTRKDLFNELYRSSMDLPKRERKTMLIDKMNLNQGQLDTLNCYMAGMTFSEIAKIYQRYGVGSNNSNNDI